MDSSIDTEDSEVVPYAARLALTDTSFTLSAIEIDYRDIDGDKFELIRKISKHDGICVYIFHIIYYML